VSFRKQKSLFRSSDLRTRRARAGEGAVGVVVEIRAEPFLDFFERHSLAGGVGFDLVAFDFSDGEILRLRVGEIEPADAAGREHGEAFGERDPGVPLGVEELPERPLLSVVGLRWIAGGGADAAVFFADHFFGGQVFI